MRHTLQPIWRALISIAVGAVVGTTGAVSAQTITVDTTEDFVDFGGAQRVSDLPGPDGLVCFREGCIAANNTLGPQDIEFAIPFGGPDWNNGVAMLEMDFDVFVLSDDSTTVDFTTQTDFTGDTNPNGNEVGISVSIVAAGVPAIIVSGDHCVILGLDRVTWAGYAIELTGNHNLVIGCSISGPLFAAVNVEGYIGGPVATGNTIGGTGIDDGNLLEGLSILGGTDDTRVVGNIVRGGGVRIEGATQYDLVCSNVQIGGPIDAERNILQGGGGYGEEGFPTGQKISVIDADNVTVEGNFIGTTEDGSAHYSQRAPAGVKIRNARNVTVRDNLISGIAITGVNHYEGQRFGDAVSVIGNCVNTEILGNLIGTDATGSYAIANYHGVVVQPFTALDLPTNTVIGGTEPGAGNWIAFNEVNGVRIAGSSFGTVVGVRIQGNSIFSNGALGIDLLNSGGQSGVSLNDAGDADSGANDLQNFPVIQSATRLPNGLRVVGTLNSQPSTTFQLDFFASPQPDPTGFGEGRDYLGSANVVTNANGIASFNLILPAPVKVGWFITATATNSASGSTSEFSAAVIVKRAR